MIAAGAISPNSSISRNINYICFLIIFLRNYYSFMLLIVNCLFCISSDRSKMFFFCVQRNFVVIKGLIVIRWIIPMHISITIKCLQHLFIILLCNVYAVRACFLGFCRRTFSIFVLLNIN